MFNFGRFAFFYTIRFVWRQRICLSEKMCMKYSKILSYLQNKILEIIMISEKTQHYVRKNHHVSENGKNHYVSSPHQ